MSPGLGGAGGSSCVPLGPIVARTPDGQDQAGFRPDSWASRGPLPSRDADCLPDGSGGDLTGAGNHQESQGECQATLQRRTPWIPGRGASPAGSHGQSARYRSQGYPNSPAQ